MPRPKVLLIINEPTPYRLHLLHRFMHEIPEISLQVVFTSVAGKLSVPWQLELREDLHVVSLPSQKVQALGWRAKWRLGVEILEYIKNESVNFVLLHGYADLTRIRFLLGSASCQADIFIRGDSNYFDERTKPLYKRFVKECLLRRLLRNVAGVMPMGTAGRAYFSTYMPDSKPSYLVPYEPNYEALRNVTEDERAEFLNLHGLDPNRKRMLYCGRMIQIKRVDMLLKSFDQIASKRPEWDLVLAGTGEDFESLKSSVRDEIRSRVHWLGFLQFDQIRRCYAACDILVHPSVYEPWGLVINEAVAAGMSVVTTNVVGAGIELIRHGSNGLLVSPGDQDGLTTAMLKASEIGMLQTAKANAPKILEQWQRAADPVAGLRSALLWSEIITG